MTELSALCVESDDEEIRMPAIKKAKSEGFRTQHKIRKERGRQAKKIESIAVKFSPKVERVEDLSQGSSPQNDASTSADSQQFVCAFCPARYSSSRALGGHVSKQHKGMS